jgi:methylmalonyl-CoA mutase
MTTDYVADARARWEALAQKALATKGGAGKPLSTLTDSAQAGLPVEPLYLSAPGAGVPARLGPIEVAQCLDASTLSRTSEAVAGGADALWLEEDALERVEAEGLTSAAHPVFLAPGADLGRRAKVAAALTKGGHRLAALGWDPLALEVATCDVDAIATGVERALAAAPQGALALDVGRVLAVSGSVVHAVGLSLAGVAALARLPGVSARGFSALNVVLEGGVDWPVTVALVRATRLGLAKVGAVLGWVGAPRLVGRTSQRSSSSLDPDTDLVRASVAAFGLLVGGVDVLAARPVPGVGDPLRFARNVGLVLRDEARLGPDTDPAAGSHALESLTDALARAGWAELQQIEREGGLLTEPARRAFARRVAEAGTRAEARVRSRRQVLVGMNDFVAAPSGRAPVASGEVAPTGSLFGEALPLRLGAPFEALRARSLSQRETAPEAAPRLSLHRLDPEAVIAPREAFLRRFCDAFGFELTEDPGAPLVALVGSDESYAKLSQEDVAALERGGRSVVIAGRPEALSSAAREREGSMLFVHLGVPDAVALAERILESVAR